MGGGGGGDRATDGALTVRSVRTVRFDCTTYPRVGNLTWPPSLIMKRAWKSTIRKAR